MEMVQMMVRASINPIQISFILSLIMIAYSAFLYLNHKYRYDEIRTERIRKAFVIIFLGIPTMTAFCLELLLW